MARRKIRAVLPFQAAAEEIGAKHDKKLRPGDEVAATKTYADHLIHLGFAVDAGEAAKADEAAKVEAESAPAFDPKTAKRQELIQKAKDLVPGQQAFTMSNDALRKLFEVPPPAAEK